MEPPGTRPGSTAPTAATEDKAAAQRRAQEIVARIKAEKAAAAAAAGATNSDALVASSHLTAAAAATAGALRDCSAAAADTLAAAAPPVTPPRPTATANSSAQTPERTPQIPTPARENLRLCLRPIIDDASASTGISTVLARNQPSVRTTDTQLGGGAGAGALEFEWGLGTQGVVERPSGKVAK